MKASGMPALLDTSSRWAHARCSSAPPYKKNKRPSIPSDAPHPRPRLRHEARRRRPQRPPAEHRHPLGNLRPAIGRDRREALSQGRRRGGRRPPRRRPPAAHRRRRGGAGATGPSLGRLALRRDRPAGRLLRRAVYLRRGRRAPPLRRPEAEGPQGPARHARGPDPPATLPGRGQPHDGGSSAAPPARPFGARPRHGDQAHHRLRLPRPSGRGDPPGAGRRRLRHGPIGRECPKGRRLGDRAGPRGRARPGLARSAPPGRSRLALRRL